MIIKNRMTQTVNKNGKHLENLDFSVNLGNKYAVKERIARDFEALVKDPKGGRWESKTITDKANNKGITWIKHWYGELMIHTIYDYEL